jgi:excisionase family DNA binding protein
MGVSYFLDRRRQVMGVSTNPRLLTVAEVADILRTKPHNVASMCRRKRIRATKPFGTWLIPADAVTELLEKRSNGEQGNAAPESVA